MDEIEAVLSRTEDVIALYEQSREIFDVIRDKRKAKGTRGPPRLLGESLLQGPIALEAAHRRGAERFGSAFADGDGKIYLTVF